MDLNQNPRYHLKALPEFRCYPLKMQLKFNS